MRIHNLYTDSKGESHFRDIEVEWVEERRGSKLSNRLPANGIIFRETQAEHDLDWHPAPRRQYIVNLDDGVELTASDGEKRVIAAREVILVEDLLGLRNIDLYTRRLLPWQYCQPLNVVAGQTVVSRHRRHACKASEFLQGFLLLIHRW